MLRKQQTTSHKVASNSRIILMAIVAFLIFFMLLSSVIGLWSKYRAIRSHIKELKQQEVTLNEKKASVTTMNQYLQTPEGKEEVFRDTYRLVKPGEGIVVITKDTANENTGVKKPGFQRFWDSIMQGLGLR